MKRILKLMCLVAVVFMTGCSAVNFSVDNLLRAPNLTEEQKEIHQALVQSVGNNITLKYPKTGDNRSAYVIKNIDDEPGAEALVFYEYAGVANKDGLMVNLLDKNDDNDWVSVKEFAGAGSEVDTVIISGMGEDNDTQVIVGYTSSTSDKKTLVVYHYDDEIKTVGTENYLLLEAYDINADSTEDIVVVNRNTGDENNRDDDTYTASILEAGKDELIKTHSVLMCNNATSYVHTATGKLNENSPALYIDELTDKNELQTEIIYFENDGLINPIEADKDRLLPLCTRPAGYYSQDIDRDGVVEIPLVRVMTGYENVVEEEKQYLTDWLVYDNDLLLKYSGYYCLSDGYMMAYPSRWTGQVTVKKDNDTQEMVFYKYDGDINGEMTELMRIAVAGDEQKTRYLYDGYQLVSEKGQLCYLVKIGSQREEPLVPTIDEIKNCFYLAG